MDDLQWADEASLLLLRHVVTRSPLVSAVILSTYREAEVGPGHPLRGLMADLRRDIGFHRVSLAGLDVKAVAALAAAVDPDGTLDSAVSAGALRGRTNGNPFFIVQLVRHLAEQGDSHVVTASEHSVPEGVREVIGRRLSRLPLRAVTVLRLAAVVGDDFDLPLLESVDGTGDELDAVEAAVAAVLVTETANPMSFRFVHALVRETLYAELSAARRARLHRAVGEALAQSPDAPPADIARHLRAGAAAGGLDAAIDWTCTAIDEAFNRLAQEDVSAHAVAALEVLDRAGEQQSQRRARLLCDLSIACSWLGDIAAGKAHALAAADIARVVGSATLFIEAALLYADYLTPAAPDPAARRLLDEALGVAGPDPAQRSQLLCHGALHRAINEGGGFAGVQELLDEAVPLARASGDDAALAWALTTQCVVQLGSPDVDAQLRAASELEELVARRPRTAVGRHAPDRATAQRPGPLADIRAGSRLIRRRPSPTASIVLRHRGLAWLQHGDRAAFDRDHHELRLLADANLGWFLGASATLWDGLVALMEGRVGAAEASLARLLEESHGDPNLVNSYGAQLFFLRRDQGRIAEVLPLLERAAATSQGLVATRALLALAYCEVGRDTDARRIFEALAVRRFATLPRDMTWSLVLAVLTEMCWQLGDRERAPLLERLCETLRWSARRRRLGGHLCGGDGPVPGNARRCSTRNGPRQPAFRRRRQPRGQGNGNRPAGADPIGVGSEHPPNRQETGHSTCRPSCQDR
jgi:hypothetical protein